MGSLVVIAPPGTAGGEWEINKLYQIEIFSPHEPRHNQLVSVETKEIFSIFQNPGYPVRLGWGDGRGVCCIYAFLPGIFSVYLGYWISPASYQQKWQQGKI